MTKQNLPSRFAWIGLLWFLFFLFIPLLFVFYVAISQRGVYGGIEPNFTFESFVRIWDPLYFTVLLNSLKMSALTTMICWILGLALAWAIGTAPSRLKIWLILALTIPSLTNLVVRVYAINYIASPMGLVAQFVSWIDPHFNTYVLSQNIWLTYYGLVTTYLPFMTFPLFVAVEKLDFTLVEAGSDLGAGPVTNFAKIIWPQLQSASLTGATLVFIPCLGEYLIPDMLGGAKVMMIGNLISEQFLKARDWPFGSAIALVILLTLGLILLTIELLRRKLRWRH